MTEKEKMLKGEPYKAFGEELFGERQYAKKCYLNLTPYIQVKLKPEMK